MPVIVNTRSGVVREILGTAVLRKADGTEQPLQPGDRIAAGDQILTAQDSIVEIVQDAPAVPPAVPGDADLGRVIQAVDQGQADVAPAAGLDGAGGGASLAPGLRVDRIAELLGSPGDGLAPVPGSLLGAPLGQSSRPPEDGLAAPAEVLPPVPPTLLIALDPLGNDSTPTLAGSSDAPPGSSIVLQVTDASGAQQTLTTVVLPDGSWQVDVPLPLVDGVFTVAGTVTTPLGQTADDLASATLDTQPPLPTLVLDPIAGDDLLLAAEAGAPVTLSGRAGGDAQPGDVVTLTVGGQSFAATVQADGRFGVEVPGALLAGAASAVVTARLSLVDAAGNVGSATAARPYTVDRAPVAVADAAALGEDGPAAAGDLTPGTPGQDSDPEGGALTVIAVAAGDGVGTAGGVGTALVGTWGTLVVQADGRYTYTPDAAAQALRAGETASERFSYRIADANGNTATSTLTVTLTGANDAPAFGGTLTGTVDEDGVLAVAGRVTVADPDAGESLLLPQAGTAGAYGRFTVDAQGNWTYVLDNASPAVQGLAAGQTVLERFPVQSADGSLAEVVVTVQGRDDAPVISSASARVVEDEQPTAAGTLTATDADNPGLAFVAETQAGTWGTLSVGADGAWSYALGPAAQALGEGAAVSETFTVRLDDGSTTTVRVDVTGRDDPAQVGNGSGQVTEDSQPQASGTLPASDADNPALAFVPATLAGTWGTLVLDAAGAWTYTLGPQAQGLAGGQLASERFTVALNDGSTTTVAIAVTGTDDAPVVSSGSGAVVEDSAPTATGTLSASDADNPALAFVPATLAGSWGTLVLEASGAWRYALGPQAQVLGEGQAAAEAFQVFLTDGSATTVQIAVTGIADPLVLDLDADNSSGATGAGYSSSFAPRGGPVAIADADLSLVQVDAGPLLGATLRLVNAQPGDLLQVDALPDGLSAVFANGTLTISGSASAAEYAAALRAVRFDNPADAPDATTRRIEVTLDNGSVQSNVGVATLDVVADALNDVPVNTLPAAFSVAEDQATALGGVAVADPDAADGRDGFELATVQLTVGQGTLAVTLAAGASVVAGQIGGATLTLSGSQAAINATLATLGYQGRADFHGSDTLVMTSTDGLGLADTDTLAIEVRPVNDAPSGADRTLVLVEDGSVVLRLEDFGFADAPGESDALLAVRLQAPSAGTLTLDGVVVTGPVEASRAQIEAGALRFAPAPDASGAPYATLDFQVRDSGGTADGGQDTDPTPQRLGFVVQPVDDAPVVSSGAGSVTEDTTPSAAGTLSASDADNPALAFVPATLAGTWGSLELDAAGNWTYTLGPAAQALAAGQVETEVFTVALNDGATTTTVTVTVTGTDDLPVISAGSGAVTEDTAPSASGTLSASDIDNPALAFVPATLAGTWGTLALDASGAWTYTLGPQAQALAPGQGVGEVFNVTLTDGSTTTVTLSVTGSDDDPVVSTGRGTVTEDLVPTASGTLSASDIDNPGLAFVAGAQAGAWGELVLDASGAWTYTLGAAAQALAAGQVETEVFTVVLNDGTTTTVTLTVNGTDDLPVVSAGTGAVVEDTAPSAGGRLTAIDVDNPTLAFVAGNTTGAFGQLTVGADGLWTYALGGAAQTLAAGQVETEVFTVQLTDGTSTTVTITVTGTDDLPVVSAGTGAVVEDTTPSASGRLTASDIDNPALAFVASAATGAFGQLTVDANGQWSYTLGAAAQALAAGQVETEVFTVQLTDGTSTTVTITVTGADDLPVVSAGAGAVVEDSSPSASGQLTASDIDNPTLAFVAGNTAGAFGQLTVDASGQWAYTLGAAAQALAAGQVEVEVFTVTLTDGTSTTVTITVTGTDDLPVVSAGIGAVVEDSAPSASGQLTASDVDNPSLAFVAGNAAGAFGQLTVDANGRWSYTLGPAAQALAAGQVETEVFTVQLTDGTSTTVTITVTGTDDLPAVSTGTGAVVEDISPTAIGQLSASDIDNPSLAFVAANTPGNFGQLTVDASGQWTYTLGAAAQALAAGQVETEVFTVQLTDGTSTTVTVTVTGTDDLPVVSAGIGAVVEDASPSASGQLTASDIDNPSLAFVAGNVAGAFGQLTVDATGQWTYTLGPASQALAAGQVETEAFVVQLTDGTSTTVTITVTGTDDLPVVSTGGGTVVEDSAPSASGQLTASDIDNPSLAFVAANAAGAFGQLTVDASGQWLYTLGPAAQALAAGQVEPEVFTVQLTDGTATTITIMVTGTDDLPVVSTGAGAVVEDTSPTASGQLSASDIDNPTLAFVAANSAGVFGQLTIDANGLWTYALGAAAQALAAGQVETEVFEVQLTDGTSTTVTITVTGTDDLPVVSTGTGAVVEDTSPSVSGQLTASDIDNPALAFVASTAAGTFGQLTVDASGLWTYTLGASAQALAAGQVETEVFTVQLTDGITTTITITVTGTDDLPVVSVGTGAAVEDTSPSASGQLTASDVDNPALTFVAGNTAGAFGQLTVDTNGLWTYTLGAAAQALAAGQVETEVFTVQLTDGSSTTVTIIVTGADDLPVVSTGVGAVVEDAAPSASGQLTASDVDNPALAFVASTEGGTFGQLTVDASGQWTYTLGAAAQALAAGQVEPEVFTVQLTDGTSTTVTITVTGTDDLPVVSTGVGAVVEDSAPSASGQLTASDVDNPTLAFVAGNTAGTFGQLTVDASGQWAYTLGPAAQALAAGQVETEVFTVQLTDGTTTTVTITVTGTDDLPVVSTGTGAVVEDTSPSVSGQLTASDIDNPALAFVASTAAGTFGQLTVDATGLWTYTLGAAAQALAAGQVETEVFTVQLTDGTTTTITITVTGTDDLPVVSTGVGAVVEDSAPSASGRLTASDVDDPTLAFVASAEGGTLGQLTVDANGQWTYALGAAAQTLAAGQVETEVFTVLLTDGTSTTVTITVTGTDDLPVVSTGVGAVAEDTSPSASGQLTASDVDNPSLAFVAANTAGTFGQLTVDASGQWTYTLGVAAQALAAGQVETEVFTVQLTDGTSTTVTITVTGTDDLPVVSTGTGAVVEDTSPSASGQLTASDIDNPALAFVAGSQAGAWGGLVVDAAGAWTYTLSPAAQALAAGQVESEVFTVQLTDGSITTVTVTVTGTDDAPLVSTGAGAVVEDSSPSAGGQLTATDVDNPTLAFVAGSQDGLYGRLTIDATGLWVYALGPAAQALAGGQVETEVFTVDLSDGTSTTVTITVTGTDDLPVVSAGTGAVTEDLAPTVGGQLTATDIGNPGLAFVAGNQAGSYGQLTVDAAGLWVYVLGTAAQALADGQVETEVFSVQLTDGSSTTVTITVTGTDDLPVVSAGTGAVIEDLSPTVGGQLTATDIDNPGLAFVAGNQAGRYGQFTVDATGLWVYALGPNAQALADGQVETEVFTVQLTDGTSTTVTITVTGTDDLPVVSAGTGVVTEDLAPTVGGQLTATDIDNPSLAFVASNASGRYGQFTIDATGLWVYALGPAAQALAGGQVETEVFTVQLDDGSTTTVTITVTGTDDLPVISAGTGAVTEDLAPTIGGQLTASDVDNPSLAFVAGNQAGSYGQFTVDATGLWVYALGPAAQALAEGQVETEVFSVPLNDGSTTTVTITVTGRNDAPVLDLDGNDSSGASSGGYRTTFVVGGPAVAIADVDAVVSDIDSPRLTGATVTLAQARAGDQLSVGVLPPGLSATVLGDSVQISGSGSAAEYAAALRAVSFGNALASPDASTRTITVTVTDGSGTSNVATATVAIGQDTVNDTPVNTVPGAQVLLEDQRTAIAGVSVVDPDAANPNPAFRLASVELSVSNGTLHAVLVGGATVTAGSLGSGRFTLGGSQDAINATLASLAYQGNANYVGGDTLVLVSRDGLGLTDADTVQIRVDPVNDAPSGADRRLTIAEDQVRTLTRGDFSFQDAPGEGNNWVSLTVTAPSAGTLRLDGVAITGPTVVTVGDLDSGRLQYRAAPDANGVAYASFAYQVRDDGGTANGGQDTDPTPNTVTIDVTPVDDPVTVFDAATQVSEEGLPGGQPDTTGTPDTTDAASASGRITITDIDAEPIVVTLLAPTQALSSRGDALVWSGSGTQTLTATAGGRSIATVTVDNGGNYSFTLRGPIDHAGADIEDTRRIDIGVRATSGGRSDDGVLAVTVEDDAPVPSPVSLQVSAPKLDTNLMIVLDTSGSMLTRDGVGGATRLDSAKQAIVQLLDRYAEFGNVSVRLVTFSSSSAAQGSVWTDIATAKAQLANLSATGGTNYDAAVAQAQAAFASAGKLASGQNALYFLTDGQPVPSSGGLNTSEERAWTAFLDANLIKTFGIGLGVDAAQGPINPVAYDGQITENLNALLVTDFAQLDRALAATVPTSITAPMLAGGRFDLPTSGIGADGGFVRQMQFGSTVYTYDPANGGSVTVTGGPDQGVFDTTTNTLTVSTTLGGRFAIDLDNGEYTYTPPLRIAADSTDGFDFIATDRDGDSVASRVTVTVDLVEPRKLTTGNDNTSGTGAADAISGLEGNDTIAGVGGDDQLAGNGGADTLRGEAGTDALYGGTGNDTLEGGDGNDLLDGGAGNDLLDGGAGSDVFAWTLFDRGTGGAPASDTINGFDPRSRTQGGDVLDLRDLLTGETPGTLDRYLDFLVSGTGTQVRISSGGGFSGGSYSAAAEDQRITLAGVDIRAALGLDGGASDALIAQTLLDRGKLLVDGGP